MDGLEQIRSMVGHLQSKVLRLLSFAHWRKPDADNGLPVRVDGGNDWIYGTDDSTATGTPLTVEAIPVLNPVTPNWAFIPASAPDPAKHYAFTAIAGGFTLYLTALEDLAGGFAHNDLTGRDSSDCHPISAITDLQDALNALTDAIAGIDPGVTDHGELSGLSDNDHPQYYLKGSTKKPVQDDGSTIALGSAYQVMQMNAAGTDVEFDELRAT